MAYTPKRDSYGQVARALARQRAAERSREGERLAMRAADLTVGDIAEVVTDIVRDQKREILKHVGRMLKLVEASARPDDVRFRNLHGRLTQVESEIRQLNKGTRP